LKRDVQVETLCDVTTKPELRTVIQNSTEERRHSSSADDQT